MQRYKLNSNNNKAERKNNCDFSKLSEMESYINDNQRYMKIVEVKSYPEMKIRMGDSMRMLSKCSEYRVNKNNRKRG